MSGAGSSSSSEYLATHIRTALATDRRVLAPGLDVTVLDEMISVRGIVSTPRRRDAVEEVVREPAPGAEIVNDVEVVRNPEPEGDEEIP